MRKAALADLNGAGRPQEDAATQALPVLQLEQQDERGPQLVVSQELKALRQPEAQPQALEQLALRQ